MKTILSITFLFLLCASILPAETATITTTTDRRIEEEKRESLKTTETVITEKKQPDISSAYNSIKYEYFKRLLAQPQARKVDGIYVMMVLLQKETEFTSFPDEFEYLKTNGYLLLKKNTAWNLNDPLRKGELAYMIFKILKFKGGLHIRLFGASERYALLELIYQGYMTSGSQQNIVTGKELSSTAVLAANYLSQNHDQ